MAHALRMPTSTSTLTSLSDQSSWTLQRGAGHNSNVVAQVRGVERCDAGDDQHGFRRALVRRLDL